MGEMNSVRISPGFTPLNVAAKTYLLDTNVWSGLSSSPESINKFSYWLLENDAIAGLSMFTIFELSKATNILAGLDRLISAAAPRIYIPLLYDELADLEMMNYPHHVELLWNPITNFKESDEINFLSELSSDSRVIEKRNEYLNFGYEKFMRLEEFKENFPLDEDGKFVDKHAELFAWANTLDYLLRYFPNILIPYKNDLKSFDPSRLRSIYLRSIFLYFKYYVHGQRPGKSDFLDFAQISYLPYIDVYVTERNVMNVLEHIKATGIDIVPCDFIHVRNFHENILNISS